jgi:phosphatidylglycerol lysyltransferase
LALAPLLIRQIIPLTLSVAVVLALLDRTQSVDFENLLSDLSSIGLGSWALCLACTMASFLAIARYDRIVHGVLGTGANCAEARLSGVVAVAAAQFAGFGLLTGTLARWRMVPDLKLKDAMRVTAFVAGSFVAGWAIVLAAAEIVSGQGIVPGWAVLGACAVAAALAIGPFVPRIWPRGAPGTGAMLAILLAVCADLGFAALAFWAVIPPESGLSFVAVLPAFLLAVLAGLVCGTPGGVGAFELTLLACLPQGEPTAILAAAMGFRIVYHALPGLLAGGALVLGPRHAGHDQGVAAPIHQPAGGFAEAGLARLGAFQRRNAQGKTQWLSAERPNSLICLMQPLAGRPEDMLAAQLAEARRKGKAAMVYRATPRVAAAARQIGWHVVPIGHEPIIDPGTWEIDHPNCRQLRRQLRYACAEGVEVSSQPLALPMAEMASVAHDWAISRGGERGFCMGHFDQDYLRGQKIWIARRGHQLLGFASFHHAPDEWVLDLMRHGQNAPRGTMHALIYAAICDAKALGISRVSLATTLNDAALRGSPVQSLAEPLFARAGVAGLRRFKSSFGPTWVPRYAAAPSRLGMAAALWDVSRASAPCHRSQMRRGFIKFYS